MTELAHRPTSEFTIREDQQFWDEKQKAGLVQLGVSNASNADLAVFFHVVSRSGLDPFARQIYMIEREGKQTIQTGIDGYRLIAARAARRDGVKLAQSEPQWCGSDMVWHTAWVSDGHPAAAKVVVYRDGEPFPGTAMYREYVQRKRDGKPTRMWERMPANQLAKCAEAQALRKAFPQDLASIYVDAEMDQDSNPDPAPQRVTAAEIRRPRQAKLPQIMEGSIPDEVWDGDVEPEPVPEGQTTIGDDSWPEVRPIPESDR